MVEHVLHKFSVQSRAVDFSPKATSLFGADEFPVASNSTIVKQEGTAGWHNFFFDLAFADIHQLRISITCNFAPGRGNGGAVSRIILRFLFL